MTTNAKLARKSAPMTRNADRGAPIEPFAVEGRIAERAESANEKLGALKNVIMHRNALDDVAAPSQAGRQDQYERNHDEHGRREQETRKSPSCRARSDGIAPAAMESSGAE